MPSDTVPIYVRRLTDREILGTIDVPCPISERSLERAIRGILRNMRDDCFVDASEVYDLQAEAAK